MEQKQCEQCLKHKDLSAFHKRKNKTDGRMRICGICYGENLQITQQRAKEHHIQWELKQQQEREERARRLAQKPICHDCGGEYTQWGKVWDDFYCQPCHIKHFARSPRQVCCVCGEQKLYLDFPHQHQDYSLRADGANIYLYCHACKKAFLALPASQQALYIQSRCNRTFLSGQVIYGLVCPETQSVRYIGRTHLPAKRLGQHLKDRSEHFEEPYYTRANWMHDLHAKGLQPTMETLMEVQSAPTVLEWEHRYILHGIQQRWNLVNNEVAVQELVARTRSSHLDFLRCSFDDLVRERFASGKGTQAFVRTFYHQ